MIGRAFAPGHITGFFEIFDRPRDPLRRGSRGAGVNLSLGVLTSVRIEEAERQKIRIRLNGKGSNAMTTRRAVMNLIGKRKLGVEVESEVQLPIGQGLGMSAAGALSAALAIGAAMGGDRTLRQAGAAAHEAEVMERTGLGDVPAQVRGGWEIRVRPGFPPHGFVDRVLAPAREVAICVSGGPVPTKNVLSDPAKRRLINRVGRGCMKSLLERPTLDNFFELSYDFARRTGLASRDSLLLVEEVRSRNLGMASVSMIGNSVFAIGMMAELGDLMKAHGRVFFCQTDLGGAGPVV